MQPEVIGHLKGIIMVRCETAQQWSDLPIKFEYEGVMLGKDKWDSGNGMGVAYYTIID